MKNVQVPYKLFVALLRYHLISDSDYADEICQGLEQKLDSLVRHELYAKYKTAPSAQGNPYSVPVIHDGLRFGTADSDFSQWRKVDGDYKNRTKGGTQIENPTKIIQDKTGNLSYSCEPVPFLVPKIKFLTVLFHHTLAISFSFIPRVFMIASRALRFS